jgi:hypothetical protein
MAFDNGVTPPGGLSYAAPLLKFGEFADWPDAYARGAANAQQRGLNDQSRKLNDQAIAAGQRQQQLVEAFQAGGAIDSNGNFDPQKAQALFARFGVTDGITQMNPMVQQQQAAKTPMVPEETPPPAGGPAPVPGGVTATLRGPVQAGAQGDNGQNTITSLVTDRLPAQNQTTGQTIIQIAEKLGIDANAQLTPGQIIRVKGLLQKVAPEIAGTSVDQPASPTLKLPPSANAVAPAAMPAPHQASRAQPVAPGQPAQISAPSGVQTPQAQQAVPQQQPSQQSAPLVPLPVNPFNGKAIQSAQEGQNVISAINSTIAKLSANPYNKGKIETLQDVRSQIQAAIKPEHIGNSLVDVSSGRAIYTAPLQGGGQTGRIVQMENAERAARGEPPMTAQEEVSFVQAIHPPRSAPAMAVETFRKDFQAKNGRPPTGEEIQEFQAKQAGRTAEERAVGQRAGAIAIAVEEAGQTIPNVRALAEKSAGRGYSIWNSIENKWKVQNGDKDYAEYVQQMNSLINLYGRVISGGGKGTVSDLEHAREMLNPNMPLSAVQGSLKGFEREVAIAETAPEKVREKMRKGGGATQSPGTDGASKSTQQAPSVGYEEGGYRFKGGDPSKKANWERVSQ